MKFFLALLFSLALVSNVRADEIDNLLAHPEKLKAAKIETSKLNAMMTKSAGTTVALDFYDDEVVPQYRLRCTLLQFQELKKSGVLKNHSKDHPIVIDINLTSQQQIEMIYRSLSKIENHFFRSSEIDDSQAQRELDLVFAKHRRGVVPSSVEDSITPFVIIDEQNHDKNICLPVRAEKIAAVYEQKKRNDAKTRSLKKGAARWKKKQQEYLEQKYREEQVDGENEEIERTRTTDTVIPLQ